MKTTGTPWPAILEDLAVKRTAIDDVIVTIRNHFVDGEAPRVVRKKSGRRKKRRVGGRLGLGRPRKAVAAPKPTEPAESNGRSGLSTRVREAIVSLLSKTEMQSADSVVIRRGVAKVMGEDPTANAFIDACRNALTKLRVDGKVSRQGTMWTLHP